MSSYYVKLNCDKLDLAYNSLAEAKLAKKELKLLKKDQSLKKKAINQEQKAIRASYTERVRTRGSKFRGGGSFGKLIRTVQTANRDGDRAALARELRPLEDRKQAIEATVLAIEKAMIMVESDILNNNFD